MRIKTNYDCTFEERDMVHLAKGRQLAATLSDGSVAFRFNLDPELLQHGPKRIVSGVVVDEPHVNGNGNGRRPGRPRLLTDGKRRKPTFEIAVCPYCQKGPYRLEPHIRHNHPGKPLHPTGKFRCQKCVQRYPTEQGLQLHLRFIHNPKSKIAMRRAEKAGR